MYSTIVRIYKKIKTSETTLPNISKFNVNTTTRFKTFPNKHQDRLPLRHMANKMIMDIFTNKNTNSLILDKSLIRP